MIRRLRGFCAPPPARLMHFRPIIISQRARAIKSLSNTIYKTASFWFNCVVKARARPNRACQSNAYDVQTKSVQWPAPHRSFSTKPFDLTRTNDVLYIYCVQTPDNRTVNGYIYIYMPTCNNNNNDERRCGAHAVRSIDQTTIIARSSAHRKGERERDGARVPKQRLIPLYIIEMVGQVASETRIVFYLCCYALLYIYIDRGGMTFKLNNATLVLSDTNKWVLKQFSKIGCHKTVIFIMKCLCNYN